MFHNWNGLISMKSNYNGIRLRNVKMILKNERIFLLLLVIFSFLYHSCDNKINGKHFVIAFSQCTGHDGWRQTMLNEMKRELSFHDNVTFIYRDANANSQKQIQQIQELE